MLSYAHVQSAVYKSLIQTCKI
uniref:Uncharacterized protein n=1 Tax=Anguilla anguilla TaxID=7936 RepID=A0A0E9PKB1_ANGAN